ncbi:putative catechol oxidase [Helianthus annuus]|uniref:Catechol oxidase n=1 Tax=Helianthus annuus TaxID=4232 RepID=A0A251SCL8_HELAN|nr:polyphenol oxidase I, chloroplastic [Helianthus annuus]KAF5766507.1 putative catechol oxidase [Helianthus annuus]KAJ0452872.1 putative catechol oxidase [Helianthus annuus]KAJ0474788.1 putative catechol oxidase [Helianthus annuus]KAJ0650342.1 putative catechol oxidase [Helianthus annuus]KAJ0654112.1 putative catechol oxidase [Helianthus annuus]
MSCSIPVSPTTLTKTTFISQRALIKTHKNQTHGFRVTCNVAPNDDHNHLKLILPDIDRRSLLVGLGGLYTASNFPSLPAALADPITTPDITSSCKEADYGIKNLEKVVRTRKCCPPNIKKTIKPFVFPTEKTVKVRWPAHNGSKEQVEKYKRAIQAMKDLPEDHPHSFIQQAKIHCAYCNGGYTQVDSGFPDIDIQIHNSWLFFPYHRWYLYFYERILGKLINDPTFALPYWNWDNPAGMTIPEIFLNDTRTPNPLFDIYRDARHLPPQLVDLDFGGGERDTTSEIQIACNLSTVYRDLVRNGADTKSFFGGEYVAGDAPVANGDKSVGSVEAGCHIAIHRWVGDSTQANFEDLGNLYSAGYDPLFYAHHSNVDRMWTLWKSLGIQGHTEPTDPDWLNASYVFYDENEDLVRVYNKDCIKMDKLKYKYYEESESVFPWRKSRPAKRNKESQVALTSPGDVKTVNQLKFPVTLDAILKTRVKRPAVNRTDAEKAKANEVLLINGIKFDGEKYVKFDVFVNDTLKEGEVTTPCDPEYAGGFAQIPHSGMDKMMMSSAARFGLTELLEDTNTEGEEYATVTLVPRIGCDNLTISDIKIALVPI